MASDLGILPANSGCALFVGNDDKVFVINVEPNMGAVIGMLNSAEYVLSLPDIPKKKRYPWQPDPVALPGLLPYEEKTHQ